MKFISMQFPNLELLGNGKSIKFTEGEYITVNEDEITLLKNCGFDFLTEEEIKSEDKPIVKRTRK